jgi:hypothetical protein
VKLCPSRLRSTSVDDRRVVVAAPQESQACHVSGHDVGPLATVAYAASQRLAQHLAAVDLRAADVAAGAAEEVVLEPLELEQADQVGLRGARPCSGVRASAALTRRRRRGACASPGSCVVYCRNWLLGRIEDRCLDGEGRQRRLVEEPDGISFFLPG